MTSFGTTKSGRTDERSKRLQEAKPYDRSRSDGSTERGRYPQPSREAFGRGDRPDVPQRLCTEVAARTRNCVVFPRASWTACAIRRGDEPDEPELRCEAGRLRSATRGPSGPVSQRPAQRRRDGRASAQIPTAGRRGLYRQGAGEDAGIPHREAQEPEDRAALSLDRAFDRDGQSLLRLRVRPRFRAVLPQILQLLSDRCPAAQVAALAAPSVHRGRSPRRLPL